MSPASNVQRRRVKLHDSRLCVDALKGVGWYARCACGWEAERPFRHRADAMTAAAEHQEAHRECGF